MPNSYMKFLADTLTGFDFNENLVDTLTTVCLALALAASIYTNVKDWKKNKQGNQPVIYQSEYILVFLSPRIYQVEFVFEIIRNPLQQHTVF